MHGTPRPHAAVKGGVTAPAPSAGRTGSREDPELRDAGVDPMVVAAHCPIVLWSADPMLAVALGSSAPTPARHGLLHADAPLHNSPSVDYGVLSDGGFP